MNALLDDLDLDTTNPDTDERDINLAGAIPEGKYHARLVEATDAERGEYTVDALKFEILHGPFVGKIIEETVFHTGSDDAKTAKAKVKRRTYYHRLGLLTKTEVNGEKKYALTPGKFHLRDCLGAEVVIDVEVFDDQFTAKPGTKNAGQLIKIKKNRLTYMGIYKLDDPKVKDVPRGKSNGVYTPPPAPAAVNLDGI